MKPEIKERIEAINRGEIPRGYKRTRAGIIPSDWEVKRIGEISNIFRGASPRPINDPKWFDESSSIGWVRISDVTKSTKILRETEQYLSRDGISKSRFVEKGNIIMSICATVGKPIITGFDVCIHDGFVVFENPKVNKDFLFYYLLKLEDTWAKYGQTGSQMNLNTDIVGNEFISLPNAENEQQKIADILSTWDKAIELKEKLIEQKKEQKKGLMQRLLTGKVRLPGFKGEWKEVRLGSIGSAYNGLTGKNKEDFGSGKPYIPYKNVFNGSRINIDQLEYVQISETENQNKVKYGDIIFTASSETPEEVGMSSVLLDHVDELYLNSFCFGYRLNDFNTLIPEFAQYLFRGNVFRKELLKLAQGSTRFNLSKNEVLKIKIKIPGLEEQKKIAFVLTIFDREIDLLEQELEALKQQKKGLMQLLLTGKVRVKC